MTAYVCLHEQSHVHLNSSVPIPPPSAPVLICSPASISFPPIHSYLRVMCEGSRTLSMTEWKKKKLRHVAVPLLGRELKDLKVLIHLFLPLWSQNGEKKWWKCAHTHRKKLLTGGFEHHWVESARPACQNGLFLTIFPLMTTGDTLSVLWKCYCVISLNIYLKIGTTTASTKNTLIDSTILSKMFWNSTESCTYIAKLTMECQVMQDMAFTQWTIGSIRDFWGWCRVVEKYQHLLSALLGARVCKEVIGWCGIKLHFNSFLSSSIMQVIETKWSPERKLIWKEWP